MRAAIFNPYLDTLGGGERYTMAVATTLVKKNYHVDIEWNEPSIKEKLEKRFNINLNNIKFVNDIKRGDGYDLVFWVSDGSIPTLKARINLLHFQVPFTNVSGGSLINKFKLMRINKIVVNSQFTKEIIDKEFGVDSFVLYPPVDVVEFKPKKKQNIILSVGRFSTLLQNKRQDVLINTFKNFYESSKNYSLVLAGGVEVGADEYIQKLEREVDRFPIKIIKSPDFKTLKNLYGEAKIFWSASGYEAGEPRHFEHFGITVVEAMAAGCVPIVFNGGGHKEIVNEENGFLWSSTGDLYRFTKEITESEKLRKGLAEKATTDSIKFSYEEFENNLGNII